MLKTIAPLLIRVGFDQFNNKIFKVDADENKLLVHGCASQAIACVVQSLYTIAGVVTGVAGGAMAGYLLSRGNVDVARIGLLAGGVLGGFVGMVAGDLKSSELAIDYMADSGPKAVTKEQVTRLHNYRIIEGIAFGVLFAMLNASKISAARQQWQNW